MNELTLPALTTIGRGEPATIDRGDGGRLVVRCADRDQIDDLGKRQSLPRAAVGRNEHDAARTHEPATDGGGGGGGGSGAARATLSACCATASLERAARSLRSSRCSSLFPAARRFRIVAGGTRASSERYASVRRSVPSSSLTSPGVFTGAEGVPGRSGRFTQTSNAATATLIGTSHPMNEGRRHRCDSAGGSVLTIAASNA